MNWALKHASGEWIAPLDDDDEFTPDHIEVLLNAALVAGAEFVYGVADSEGASGDWGPIGRWPPKNGNIVHASVLYSGALRFFRHNERSWRLAEPGDWNLWKRMMKSGVRMTFVDRVVVRHFVEGRHTLLRERLVEDGAEVIEGQQRYLQ